MTNSVYLPVYIEPDMPFYQKDKEKTQSFRAEMNRAY